MHDVIRFADELGPTKVLHIFEPSIGLKAVLVIDNLARGPSIGGIRMAPDVSVEECSRLARAMTMKNAAADLPYGGGKVVLCGDPKMEKEQKEILVRALGASLKDIREYIMAPDMGIDEECMAWIFDETGFGVSKPREFGGIPLDEIGVTGFGLSKAADVALEYCDFPIEQARLVVQGFGAVGRHAARLLSEKGAILVGVSDSRGAIHDPLGLDVSVLSDLKAEGKSVAQYPGAEKLSRDAVIDIECDIWIPAARPDVITEENVSRLKTRLVLEGANIPVTCGAERVLDELGVLCVPDFIANAGGVICAAMEHQGACEATVMQTIEDKITRNVRQVLEEAKAKKVLPRTAALDIALGRVKRAMSYRRWNLF